MLGEFELFLFLSFSFWGVVVFGERKRGGKGNWYGSGTEGES